MFEQAGVMPLHAMKMGQESFGKSIPVREADKAGKSFQAVAIGWQRMGLLIVDHLQPMLNRTQETISDREIIPRLVIDPAAMGERRERGHRFPPPQGGIAAARNQLLSLDEKFDLADAAAAELNVVPLNGDLAVAAIGMNLPLHVVNVGDRSEVEIFAPNEG